MRTEQIKSSLCVFSFHCLSKTCFTTPFYFSATLAEMTTTIGDKLNIFTSKPLQTGTVAYVYFVCSYFVITLKDRLDDDLTITSLLESCNSNSSLISDIVVSLRKYELEPN